ncbi:Cullin, N-terminal [Parasponia andersonii]|uniref:Cullin-5 n=1 Tax=Parasponia andersonii TaxID=3476 RepID=A0A2P5DH92_PARAD|nr:Cullin, N-terminal [Parasponia andersonii]
MIAQKMIAFDEGWAFIENGIKKLLTILESEIPEPPFTSNESMALHTIVYKLCTQKPSKDGRAENNERLYDNLRVSFEHYLTLKALPSITDKHGELLLRELVKRWGTHQIMVRWFWRLFFYIDRHYASRKSVPMLRELGIICFKDLVYGKVKDKARDIAMVMIDKEREGERIDRCLMKSVVELFVAMGMGEMDCYEADFEALMVEKTGLYYSRKAANWVLEDSCPEYLVKAEECLKKERERVSHYLQTSSESKLVERFQHELLTVQETKLIEKEDSGLRALLRDDKVEHLSRMFSLYNVIPEGLEPIAKLFQEHITDEGTSLVEKAETASSGLVKELILLHDNYMGYLDTCFLNHTRLQKALKKAFEAFCNKTIAGSTSSAELLASFCDEILKKAGGERLSDEALEEALENVVKMLVYTNGKDLFVEFCLKKLARRLLFTRTADIDRERCMLTKLKQALGATVTSRMEGMVTDMTVAKDNQEEFDVYIQKNPHETPGIDLSVNVLTTRFWPSYKYLDLNLPPEMARCVENFNKFYHTKHHSRRLTWIYSLGTCHVNGNFKAKTIELVVSTSQAAALVLFNNADKLTYEEIMTALNVDSPDLDRLLHSLSCGKYEILKKEPRNKKISPTDTFEFNYGFKDAMRRIKIPVPPVSERKTVTQDVENSRRYAIDAGLVRIMKSRKILSYQHLVAECIDQMAKMFKPDIKDIKKRIEDLITRDFMERDESDSSMLKYVA